MPTDSETRAEGIDVSRWQQQVDWSAVKAAGITFAYIKATDGIQVVDPRFAENWAASKEAGLLRGAYHFFRPFQDPRRQAEHFSQTLNLDPGDLPPVFDLERNEGVSQATLVQGADTWLTEVERALKCRPVIYTRASFYDLAVRDQFGQYPAWAERYKLWVAHYTNIPEPRLPVGWNTWSFWQYTETGSVAGVAASVDRDRFNGSADDLKAWLQTEMAAHLQPGPSAPQPAGTIPQITNQAMINAFRAAFGSAFWNFIVRCGLTAMAIPPSNRQLPYSGPALELLPNLTQSEIAALFAALDLTPMDVGPRPPVEFLRWEHHALPGLHGPADPGGGWVQEAYEVVRQSRVQAVKMLAPDLQPGEVAMLRSIHPRMLVMARLFSGQLANPRGGGTPEGAGHWFVNEVAAPGDGNNPMNRAYNSDLRYFEVHNEPNLTVEGLGANWRDGAEFARFFNTVADTLRPRYPAAKFGFPGLSPGATFDLRPIDFWTFMQQAQAAVQKADFLCCHVYWGGDGSDYQSAVSLLRQFCERYPDKLVFCTEFSNNHPHVPRELKVDQYASFYRACKTLPTNLGAVFAYVLSWRDDHNREGFLDLSEDRLHWRATGLAARLGSHAF